MRTDVFEHHMEHLYAGVRATPAPAASQHRCWNGQPPLPKIFGSQVHGCEAAGAHWCWCACPCSCCLTTSLPNCPTSLAKSIWQPRCKVTQYFCVSSLQLRWPAFISAAAADAPAHLVPNFSKASTLPLSRNEALFYSLSCLAASDT